MRHEQVTESQRTVLELEPGQAEALRRTGERLASDSTWWGSEEDEEPQDRTVIRCRPAGSGRYSVRVSDAVGVVSLPDLQLDVRPKIPISHFLFLLSASEYFPRLDDQQASLPAGNDLFKLLARWFVRSVERLLRHGLIKDYSEEQDFLSAKRGRIRTTRTASAYYRGRIGFHCEFDEFNTDTPLNRVVLAASKLVVGRPELPRKLRQRARSLTSRMTEVGRLKSTDMRIRVTRRTAGYRNPLLLGKQLLRAEGRFLGRGQQSAWTFLIRTPELVEDGLRNLLQRASKNRWKIEKRGIRPTPSVSFNPDLLINDGQLVADVKYKLFTSAWNRSDLYQIVAFCTAFKSRRGLVVGFREPDGETPPLAQVGDMTVRPIAWPARPDVTPVEAYQTFTRRMDSVLREQLSLVVPPA